MTTTASTSPVTCQGHVWRLTASGDASKGRHRQYECDERERILSVAPATDQPVGSRWVARLPSAREGHEDRDLVAS